MQLKDSSNYMHPEEQDYENAPSIISIAAQKHLHVKHNCHKYCQCSLLIMNHFNHPLVVQIFSQGLDGM